MNIKKISKLLFGFSMILLLGQPLFCASDPMPDTGMPDAGNKADKPGFSLPSFLSSYKLLIGLPALVSYAAIVKANKEFLDFQQEVGWRIKKPITFDDLYADLRDLSIKDLEKGKKAYLFMTLGDDCRTFGAGACGFASFIAYDKQRLRDNRLVCENAFHHDLFWVALDFISACLNSRQHNRYAEMLDFKKNGANQPDTNQPDKEVSPDSEKKDSMSDDQANSTKSKLVRNMCIYVLPAIEVACATFIAGSCDNATVKGSAFRAKLRAVQSMARLLSEMLMCPHGSKKVWFYAMLFVVVVGKLFLDWGMEGRANELAVKLSYEADHNSFEKKTVVAQQAISKEWVAKKETVERLKELSELSDEDLKAVLIEICDKNPNPTHSYLKSILTGTNQQLIRENLDNNRSRFKRQFAEQQSELLRSSLDIMGRITFASARTRYRDLAKDCRPDGRDLAKDCRPDGIEADSSNRDKFEFLTTVRDFLNGVPQFELVALDENALHPPAAGAKPPIGVD